MAASLEVIPAGTVGARVEGVDLRTVGAAESDSILRAWYRHDVLVFPGQVLTEDDLLAFSRRIVALDSPPNQGAGRKSPPGYPEVYVVSNVLGAGGEPIGALGDGEALWHTDMSYAPLPPMLRARIATLDIKHDGTYDSGGNLRKGVAPSADPRGSIGTPHPIAIEHPVSGDRALYLGRRRNAYVMGLDPAESERVLDELWSFVETSVYRHRWTPGDLVLWDNRTTMHRRDAFDPRSRRIMHRTQVRGTHAPRRAPAAA